MIKRIHSLLVYFRLVLSHARHECMRDQFDVHFHTILIPALDVTEWLTTRPD